MANINQVPDTETFDQYTIIDRKPYSMHLTEFLNSKSEHGYVINLNAEWGAGKTTFLQCWYNELKGNYPVVYFDAWKSDFSHNAMMALMECFNTQLISPLKENEQLFNKIKDRVGNLIKVALPSLVVGYLKHKTGTDSDDSLLGDISTELGVDIEEDELAGALKETMKAMLQQKRQVDGLHAFRHALEELGECYLKVHQNKSAPIYILIDELDRCRPSYAIEVIECVKHFFNTKNFVFVLATDTDQLQHSIRAVYGEGFNSSAYLSRFFDSTMVLQAPNLPEYIKIKLPELAQNSESSSHALYLLTEIFNWHGMKSLREIDKVFDCIDIARSQSKCYKLLPLIVLAILKRKFPDHYNEYLSSGNPPYVLDYTGSITRDTKHLPNAKNQRLNLTTRTSVLTSWVCYMLINHIDTTINNEGTAWINTSVDNHRTNFLKASLQSLILINEDYLVAEKEEYIALIDFAGHFE